MMVIHKQRRLRDKLTANLRDNLLSAHNCGSY